MSDKIYSPGWCELWRHPELGSSWPETVEDSDSAYFHVLSSKTYTVQRGRIYWPIDGGSDD
jgi:hypothetical protein